MKFANKMFLAITALLTLIFTLFGIWLLHSNFAGLLDRELERGNSESSTFEFLFEMGYRATESYGEEYAVARTLESITDRVEQDGSHLFVMRVDGSYYAGEEFLEEMGFLEETAAFVSMLREAWETTGENSGYCMRQSGGRYFMLTAALLKRGGEPLYLGLCREITGIYEDRQRLVRQYGIALLVLLTVGGGCIYVLTQYMTKSVRELERVAKRIAAGHPGVRSRNQSADEVGELARSFNLMADRLVEQAEEKQREAKDKEDFTAAFAHELKTPLTSIIGYADMLNSMKLTEEERAEAAFYIYSQGKRLESLSHKLLELVSMDKSPLDEKPVQTKRLEENLRATVRPVWEQRGIQGKIEFDRGILFGDEELLLSLFYNLLDNAAKAMDGREGGFILLKGTRLPKEGYEVKVVDNGRGIPQEEIGRITEAFYMVDKSRSRREGGAGIGMALCHKIIRLHGGSLQIDSRLGEGTVIRVLFPEKK